MEYIRRGADGFSDQYSDGKAARIWTAYVGRARQRTTDYRDWLVGLLHNNSCQNILDAACGTGIDSIMLVEEGFDVVSTDISDKMLKYALRQRWKRRKDPAFDKWVIEEADWLTLVDDVTSIDGIPDDSKFDAVLCIGNSIQHLPDFEGGLLKLRQALRNFWALVRPGGLFLIDHRNNDDILQSGVFPNGNIYYDDELVKCVDCTTLLRSDRAIWMTAEFVVDVSSLAREPGHDFLCHQKELKFALSGYPHKVKDFSKTICETLPGIEKYAVYGDLQLLGVISHPHYFIHVLRKTASQTCPEYDKSS